MTIWRLVRLMVTVLFIGLIEGLVIGTAQDGDDPRPVRLTDGKQIDMRPLWSPDGSRILFTSFRDGNAEIYVMASDGSGVINLTNDPADDIAYGWAADGTIILTSDRDGNTEIYLMDEDGSDLRRMTHLNAIEDAPQLSPDGQHIAFVFVSNRSDHPASFDIYVMDVSDGTLHRLTDTVGVDQTDTRTLDGCRMMRDEKPHSILFSFLVTHFSSL